MNCSILLNLLVCFFTLWLSNCQQSDHIIPETPETTSVQSASLTAPTTPGPVGLAYAMQAGTQCFLLDKQNKLWQYDPIVRSFMVKASPNLAQFSYSPDYIIDTYSHQDFFSFSSADKIYLGGQSQIAFIGARQGFPSFFYVYDVINDTWTVGEPCPGSGKVSDLGRVSFFANGKGYVCLFVNGVNSDGTINYDKYLARCYEYDPTNAKWSLRFEVPVPLPDTLDIGRPSQAATLNGKGYWIANTYLKTKRGQSITNADAFTCVFELDPQTNQMTLKLTTNASFGNNIATAPTFSVALAASNKVWFISNGTFDKGTAITNQLFPYDPTSNQLTRTSASVITEPNKPIYGLIGFAIDKRLYLGMGEYGLANGTPGGLINGFAQFNL